MVGSAGLLAIFGFLQVICHQIDKALLDDIFGPPTISPKHPEIKPTLSVDTCECVAHYLCGNDSVINTNGMGIIDIRADEGPCESYLDFCCYPPDRKEKPVIPAPVVRKGCGMRNPEGVGFRIKGDNNDEAQFGELPWMVAVLHEKSVHGLEDNLFIYRCGGALIHPQVVLTAAHCVDERHSVYRIRAGEWDTQTTKEIYPHQDRSVKQVIIHPHFFKEAVFNDAALLVLESPVEVTQNVDIVCLPPQDYMFPGGTRCLASGWGKDVFGKKGKYQVILKKIELPIVDRDTCQKRLRSTRLGRFFQLHGSFICAGGEEGKDTCKGDGGSPLVSPIPGHHDQYQLAGIVSWGIGCGEHNIPGVYTNVARFRCWIDEQMAHHKLDPTIYQY